MRLSKWAYYARSIPLLLGGVKNWTSVPIALLGGGRGRIVRLADLSFLYRDAMDVWAIKETCLDDHYRVAGLALRPGDVVIDIGGGLGDFAIMVGRRHPQARVLAFEPFPESAALFRRNLALNGAPNVTLVEQAVAGGDGALSLDVSAKASVQHSTVRAPAEGATIAVATRSLAAIFAEHAVERCAMLKLDCEGAEFDILLSLDQGLLARIDRISMEYHDAATAFSHRDLEAFLGRAGFTLRRVASPVHADLGYLYAQR
jgi:FkbM family methyltransferase